LLGLLAPVDLVAFCVDCLGLPEDWLDAALSYCEAKHSKLQSAFPKIVFLKKSNSNLERLLSSQSI
jgi:hypothetical protein